MTRAQGPVEQIIRQRVAEHPGATWLKWQDTEVAWRDVLSNALRAANGLLELGVRPSERVAILMANRPEFLWAHLGVLPLQPGGVGMLGDSLPDDLLDRALRAGHGALTAMLASSRPGGLVWVRPLCVC